MSDLRVTLPGVPPSVNDLSFGKGKAYRSEAYTQWKTDAVMLIRSAKVRDKWRAKDETVYRITIWWTRPDRRKRDSDNILKVVADALMTALEVDDQWFEFTTHRAIDSLNPHVDIKVSVDG